MGVVTFALPWVWIYPTYPTYNSLTRIKVSFRPDTLTCFDIFREGKPYMSVA